MKEIRLNGIVLRPTSRGWQVGKLGMRNRGAKLVEYVKETRDFGHDLEKAARVFISRAQAEGVVLSWEWADFVASIERLHADVAAQAQPKKVRTRKRKPDGPRIYVRVSPDERDAIAEAAKADGITLAEFVRAAALESAFTGATT